MTARDAFHPTAAERTLIEGFKAASTSVISDNLARLPGAHGLMPYHSGGGMIVGPALTVRTTPGDNLFIHRALEMLSPGDILVVDGGGDTTRALIGEIMMTNARMKKAAGVVIDGAIRDARAIRAGTFPVYARAVNHRGPYKNGPGEIDVPVSVGGMIVSPGDIVCADEDGVVAFPRSVMAKLLPLVQAQETREAETIKSILEGRYTGSYGAKG